MELILCKIYRNCLLEVEVATFVAQVAPTPCLQFLNPERTKL